MVFPDNDPGELPWNRSGYFMKRNFGKRSLSLELNTERGVTIFKRLLGERRSSSRAAGRG